LARQASPGTTFIERKKLKAPESLADLMGLDKGDHIIKVKRLRFVNNEPVAILSSYLPEDLVPNLIDVEFKNNSLYKTLEGIYGFRLREADEVIEAGSINPKDAKWLEVPKMTPILVVKRLTYLDTGRVIEKLTALYRSDRFKYQVKLEGRPENRL
jgi:GntR family transcriptional regulator